MRYISLAVFICLLMLPSGCTKKPEQMVELKKYSLDTLEGVITQSGVEIDQSVSSDGKGSLKVSLSQPTIVHLFETGPVDAENSRLLFRAKVRTEGVSGKAYLEMWCHFPDKGEFFSRGLQSAVTGTTQWTSQEIPFFLKKGERPDNVKLNLVIDGTGTAWIDDISLWKGPLP